MRMTMTALLLALTALAAMAQTDVEQADKPEVAAQNYSYVDIAYMRIEIDDVDETAHGLGVTGSFELNDWFHLWVDSEAARLDVEGVDITGTAIGFGGGTHVALGENVSAYARAGYLWGETEVDLDAGYGVDVSLSEDGDGYSLGVGIRASVLPALELTIGAGVTSFEDESSTGWGGGALYSLTDRIAFGLGLSHGDDALSLSVGLRAYFK